MTERIVVKCKGSCAQEVNAAEVDADGVCTLCQVMGKVATHYEEYKVLWRKIRRYRQKGFSVQAREKQLGRVVGRIARECHQRLPVNGAVRLVNEICERARAEVEGYDRILTVRQALVPTKPQKKGSEERQTASGIYLPGR